ncbi:MAG: rhodanese-like domain-containing protein [Anaerolineae bacterium]|nr:rhodanese-like domain-containing protein [Anaerolineae bacterium]
MTSKTTSPRWLLAVALVLLFAVSACAPAAEAAVAVPTAVFEPLDAEVSVGGAALLRDGGAFMLDVREPDEWQAGHIPGATLIPRGELEARLDELPTDRPIVVYCRSGNRSAVGRDILLDAGFLSVTSMAGGFNAWAQAGYETEKGE